MNCGSPSQEFLKTKECPLDLSHLSRLSSNSNGPGFLSEGNIAWCLSHGVIVGNTLDPSLSCNGDVASVIAKVKSHHGHDCRQSSLLGRTKLGCYDLQDKFSSGQCRITFTLIDPIFTSIDQRSDPAFIIPTFQILDNNISLTLDDFTR